MQIVTDFNPILNLKINCVNEDKVDSLRYELNSLSFHAFRLSKILSNNIRYFFLEGGFSGEKIKSILLSNNIDFYSIGIQDENRIDFEINNKRLQGISPRIKLLEKNQALKSLLNYSSDNLYITVINDEDFRNYEDLYKDYLKDIELKKHKLLLQTIGIPLDEIIKYKPFFWILDVSQLENYYKIKFESDLQLVNASEGIISAGIKHLLLTRGNTLIYTNGTISYSIKSLTDKNFFYNNSISGLISGVASSIEQNCDIITTLRLSMAFHNIKIDDINAEQEVIKNLIDKSELIELNN